MTTVTLERAEKELATLIERARAGEEIVITTPGRHPGVQLKVLEVEAKSDTLRQRPGAGRYKGLLVSNEDLFGPLPDDELKLWTGEE